MDSTEHTDITTLEFLTECHLHESHWDSNEEQADPVWDEEKHASPSEAEVRETPEVSETDTVADHSNDVSPSTQPTRTGRVRGLVLEGFVQTVFKAYFKQL